jgi:hypothetical protein
VVGALEQKVYGQYERFQALPAVDEKAIHRCCGIGFDCGEGDWDDFQIALRGAIEKRFLPVPSTDWLRLRQASVGEKELCVIDITEPDEYYRVKVGRKGAGREGVSKELEESFFIRVEGSSRSLSPTEAEEHMRKNPRRGNPGR